MLLLLRKVLPLLLREVLLLLLGKVLLLVGIVVKLGEASGREWGGDNSAAAD